jgi:hypothetical protein
VGRQEEDKNFLKSSSKAGGVSGGVDLGKAIAAKGF